MLQTRTQYDPIVEILRHAYRRGLAVRRKQLEERKVADAQPLERAKKAEERNDIVKQDTPA